jgi:hypothetical protein
VERSTIRDLFQTDINLGEHVNSYGTGTTEKGGELGTGRRWKGYEDFGRVATGLHHPRLPSVSEGHKCFTGLFCILVDLCMHPTICRGERTNCLEKS